MIKACFKKKMQTPRGTEWLDIDVHIAPGEFVTIFGESGAGKTTFLRILAGLTQADSGVIEVEGEVWFDSSRGTHRAVGDRNIGFVSQESSLFPHMTVFENLRYACGDRQAIGGWIKGLGLQGLEDQKPGQLSAGQKQRVALARALLRGPRLLLLDEPLSGLDVPTGLKVQDEIIKAYQKTGITTILVTHHLSEVFKLSRKVFVLEHGQVTKSGHPQEVFVKDNLSGEFKFGGQILEIIKDGILNIVTLQVGNQVVKVTATDEEMGGLNVGHNVVIASKAFNPIIVQPEFFNKERPLSSDAACK